MPTALFPCRQHRLRKYFGALANLRFKAVEHHLIFGGILGVAAILVVARNRA